MLLLLPSTVMKLMLARVEPSMRIWAAMGELSTRLVELATIPSAGAVMMAAPVAPLLAPFKVRRLLMVICSGYEPGQTKIVLLAGTELIAAVMVAKEVYWGRQVPTAAVAAKAGTEASATQSAARKRIRNILPPEEQVFMGTQGRATESLGEERNEPTRQECTTYVGERGSD